MSAKSHYRPDIDGLRALAVLLVLGFHAQINVISGGFIGVDVFFVISGFLITRIIANEVKEGRFSYGNFYLRRIKRIMPALVVLLIATTIPAYILLFSDDFEVFARNLIHAFIATSNFFLLDASSGYFSANTSLFPLLHTWSLAVEEQFYLIWPLVFVLIAKATGGKHIAAITFVLLALATALSVYLSNHTPNAAYYLLPARAFELLMGAQLAIIYKRLPETGQACNHILSVVGLALILAPSFLIDKESTFPGLNALWPCLGTALLIFTGRNVNTQGIVNHIVSKPAPVFIGLISYSLYLWHWPIFVYIQYLGLELNGAIRIFAILMAFAISYGSWRLVEKPMRNAKIPTLGSGMRRVVLPSFLVLATIYGLVDAQNGFPSRFKALSEFDKKNNFPSTVREACFDAYAIGNVDQCWLGVKKENVDGMLIGDSFANHSASFVDVLAKDAGLLIHDSAAGGYPLLASEGTKEKFGRPPTYGVDRLAYAKQFEHLIVAANWEQYTNPAHINYRHVIDTLDDLVEQDVKIYVIVNLPSTTKENLHRMKLKKSGAPIFFGDHDPRIVKPTLGEDHIIPTLQRRFPQITYIDLKDAACDSTHCNTSIDETIIYRNFNHLNTSGAALLGVKYLSVSGNPLVEATAKQ